MFEGTINRPAMGEIPPGGLRPLDWSELVARFAAARDLRALMARPAPGSASFALASVVGWAGSPEERGVNPDGLACGKWSEDMSAIAAPGVVGGDRETR